MSNDKPGIDDALLEAIVMAAQDALKEASGIGNFGVALLIVAPDQDSLGRRYCRHISNIDPAALAGVFESTAVRIKAMLDAGVSSSKVMH